MSKESLNVIEHAQIYHAGVYVSAITAWEVATLVSKDRYHLKVAPSVWFSRLLSLTGVRLAETSLEVLIDSAFLPDRPPTDPVDRILVATARRFGFTLITRDRQLLNYAAGGYLNALAC